MRPVEGGTQKLTMNSADRDYEQRLRQAKAQADGNPFVAGVQSVFNKGASSAMQRSPYGDVSIKPQELLLGPDNGWSQKDAPGNTPLDAPYNQTASLELKMSPVVSPNKDMEKEAEDKIKQRLELYAQAGSNAGFGNNNRQQTLRLN